MDSEATSGFGGERFAVTSRREAAAVVVTVSGELDQDTAGPLREALDRHVGEGHARIIVDCVPLSFCDSTGLNALLHARLAAQDTGGRIDLAGLHAPVARMFEITGAHTVFRVYADVDEALADEPPA
jgi:anti-anti-sigma factor